MSRIIASVPASDHPVRGQSQHPGAPTAGGRKRLRAPGRRKGTTKVRSRARNEPNPVGGLTPSDIEELREAFYELEITRGDWSKAR